MPLYEFEGKRPVIADSCFIHPQAVIIGDVKMGENCFVGAGAVIRGDYGRVVIGDGCNVQENCVIHSEPETSAILEDNVLVGHGAVVHGPCLLKTYSTVGMMALVSSGCELGRESLLAAGSILPPGRVIPDRKLALGNPAKAVKDVTDYMVMYSQVATKLYQDLAARCKTGLKLIQE